MAYVTQAEIKQNLVIKGDSQNDLIDFWIQAACDAIDAYCNREQGKFEADTVASARYYAGSGKHYILIDECVAITEVAVKVSPTDSVYEAWDTADWIAYSGEAKMPNFNALPFDAVMSSGVGTFAMFTSGEFTTRPGFRPEMESTRRLPTVKITAKWGYSVAVPERIKAAVSAQCVRWVKRAQGAFENTLVSNELGQMEFKAAPELDPDIKFMVAKFRVPNVGGLR